ncbi:ACT domain-containing protein ACR4 [Hibiscus syriacus]|uniref:ACT domain-containing protein ACR n=1 Tax=Hibiscus syriacus TaxID=106335 RepID=A0A6A3B4J4_HIBSY|nr:ACT domain-containing protein ACR4 [Hibiscus syriacus]
MEDEFAKLIRRINPPRVVVDNGACENATFIQVDSVYKHGILLELVQLLSDMNLNVTKAYVSSDAGWFMDDDHGNKITDEGALVYIERTLETKVHLLNTMRSSVDSTSSEDHTLIELTGSDRPGLLSELSAVLADMECDVVNAEMWTHNGRAAAVIHVIDHFTRHVIEDPKRVSIIKELLFNVMKGDIDAKIPTARMSVSTSGKTHRGRRLHQILFADRDFERPNDIKFKTSERPHVSVMHCSDRDYTVVMIRCLDRPKLLFDTVCCLTDMEYVVFHGTVVTGRMEAYQEYYIRHVDGFPVNSEAEKQRVMECLEAAIERRTTEGLELEVITDDRSGLLSDITRIFRENGLCIKRAEICSSNGGKAKHSFFVTDVGGNSVDPKTLDLIQNEIGQGCLIVKGNSFLCPKETTRSYLFGNLFKRPSFQSFKLIKSCS